MTAAPMLLAGLMPVPVIGIVARCTMNTANPIGSGANTFDLSKLKRSDELEFLHCADFLQGANTNQWKVYALTGTWESRALRFGSVAEKTVYTSTKVPMISAARPVPVE